ncbi:hypothetical protein SteCoe_36331 [Stentor coeruleus]|uniref:Uncharacterized protein n=1 Tax=Stentor coeruleus TaxID=5963 RepID=A0A1R2AQD9_9CILI|nr:hypothetical protein SteCoe_36331 [Stentor coeruleus]
MERKPGRSLTLGTEFVKNIKGVWKEITTQGSLPRRRSYHTAVSWRSTLFILGGQDLREGALEGLWMLRIDSVNPDAERWVKLKIQGGPGAISRHTAVVFQNLMYVYGGTNTIVQYNTLYILDLEKMIWRTIRQLDEDNPPKMDSHSCVVYNSNLVFFGGYVSGYRSSILHLFDTSTELWDKKDLNGPCPRSNHSASVFQKNMYVFGGFDEDHSTLNDFWRLNLETWTWHPLPLRGDAPAARSGHSTLIYRNNLILFGGIKEIGHETNELFYCNIEDLVWVLIFHTEATLHKPRLSKNLEVKSPSHLPRKSIDLSKIAAIQKEEVKEIANPMLKENEKVIPVPCARDGHSACVVDEKMYVFGGDKHQMSFNDLYAYSLIE